MAVMFILYIRDHEGLKIDKLFSTVDIKIITGW